MLVEPLAGDNLEENLHVSAQILYGLSKLTCTAVSKSQGVALVMVRHCAAAAGLRLSEVHIVVEEAVS